jgi:hypothetical protein
VLAVEFVERDPPSNIVTLIFSGGGAIRLEVECLSDAFRLYKSNSAMANVLRTESNGVLAASTCVKQ